MRSAARRDASLITPCATAAISCVLSAAASAAALLLPLAPARSRAAAAAPLGCLGAAASVKLVQTE
jgi:hypothetical protein